MNEPLSIDISADKRPLLNAEEFFLFDTMKSWVNVEDVNYNVRELGTFYNDSFSNQLLPF